jgi:hypothetical protein
VTADRSPPPPPSLTPEAVCGDCGHTLAQHPHNVCHDPCSVEGCPCVEFELCRTPEERAERDAAQRRWVTEQVERLRFRDCPKCVRLTEQVAEMQRRIEGLIEVAHDALVQAELYDEHDPTIAAIRTRLDEFAPPSVGGSGEG